MGYFCENLNQDNFSFNFGENVRFTQSYYEGSEPSDSAIYWMGYCENYNSPFRIPNTLKNGYDFFGYGLNNFNSPVYIDPHHPNLETMPYFFYHCPNFNQPFNIPDKVYNLYYTLYECDNFNTDVYCYAKVGNCYYPNDYNNQIGNFSYAFYYWSGNFNLHFMDSNPTVLDSAFYGCGSLNANIQIPSSVVSAYGLFSYCYSLNQNIRIPDGVSAGWCFHSCYSFNQNIRIPRGSDISHMFYNCNSFNQPVHVPLYTSGINIFFNCDNLNANVTFENGIDILYGTFRNCNNFNYPITIPDSVTDMYETFYHCLNFNTQPYFGSSILNMYYAFAGCYNLNTNIILPPTVQNLYATFRGCENLNQNIFIPNGVVQMRDTFAYCRNLDQSISIPSSVNALDNCFEGCRNLNSVITIPTGVESMGGTFQNCNNFNQYITIPSSVTHMRNTFAACENLNQPISFPSSVTYTNYCFWHCNRFKQPMIIPESCNSMYGTFIMSGVNNVNIRSAYMNFWDSTGGYGLQTMQLFAFRAAWYEYQNYQIVKSHPYLSPDGLNNGDTIATITLNRNCIYFCENWNSTSQTHENSYYTTEDLFYSYANKSYVYKFVGVLSGWISVNGRSYYRENNQAHNYNDYVNNFHDNIPSIILDSSWYYNTAENIRFTYRDWENTYQSEGVNITPQYNIFINFY